MLNAATAPLWKEERFAVGGHTIAESADGIDAALLSATVTPAYALINLGANDADSLPAEATLKADYLYVLDAVHAKWPAAQCYLMRVWRRGYAANCNTLAGYIDDIVAARSFAHVGPDERVFLENGDDGVTYTTDGVHQNAAGDILSAQQWAEVLGY